jgi:hypothetical protein
MSCHTLLDGMSRGSGSSDSGLSSSFCREVSRVMALRLPRATGTAGHKKARAVKGGPAAGVCAVCVLIRDRQCTHAKLQRMDTRHFASFLHQKV